MEIAIIGTGNMGSTLAGYFAEAGHNVVIASRDIKKAQVMSEKIGLHTTSDTIPEAVGKSEVVFLAVPHVATAETLEATGAMKGKIVVDMSNPFSPPDFELSIGHTTSAAEEMARLIPDAKVVKAFSHVFATVLKKGKKFGEATVQIFCASNDQEAKQHVIDIIESAGFKAIDAGKLMSARYIEPLAALTIQVDNHLGRDVQIAAAMIERPQ